MSRIRFCHIIDASTANPLLYNSIKYSDRDRFDYRVISMAPAGELQSQMSELGVESFGLDHTSRREAARAVWRLFRYFRRERILVVQVHLFDASLIGLTAARLAGVPVRVFSGHHSHETPLYKKKIVTFIDSVGPRFLANHTIAPSQQMKEIFVRDLGVPEKKVSMIAHGFDLDDWWNRAGETNFREDLGIGDKLLLVAAGRLFWVKDYPTMIEGFARAAGNRDDAVLAIAGGGDPADLRSIEAAKKLGDKLIFLGPRKDIASVIAACDVFVHTSLAESFGMVYIEAFALGKPLICTPTGIANEIVRDGDNGYFVRPGDPDSVAAAITRCLDDRKSLKIMGESGRASVDNFEAAITQRRCDSAILGWLGGNE